MLVEGADLTARDGQVFLKTLKGLQRIDVLLRRVEGRLVDPLELTPDSTLGVPGLLDAMRAVPRHPFVIDEARRDADIDAVLREIIEDPDAAFRSDAVLYQDFLVRSRIRRVQGEPLQLAVFRRRLAVALKVRADLTAHALPGAQALLQEITQTS